VRGLLAAGLAFLAFLGAQVLVYHFARIRRRLYVMLWLWLAGLPVYGALVRLLPADQAWLPASLAAPSDAVVWGNGLVVYWFLFAAYYQLFNMADNSVGVRCLIELDRVPDGGLSLAELDAHYPSDQMLGRRLERLVAAGYLRRDGPAFQVTGRGRAAARLMAGLKALLHLGPGG
jgi:hypothetical protein